MSEAAVVNLFLTVRVLLVGGILLALPHIGRKGLLFGIYIGEALHDGRAADGVRSAWRRGCVVLMAISLLIGLGISFAGRPVTGNLTGTALLLLGALGLYLRSHSRARRIAPPVAARQARVAAAPLDGGETNGAGLAKLALAVCLVVSVATLAYAMLRYRRMAALEAPESYWSFAAVMLTPSVNMVLSPFLALVALLTAGAKRSIRGGSGGGSVEAQKAFRTTMTNLLSWTALLVGAVLTVISLQIVRLGRDGIRSFGVEIAVMAAVVVLFLAGNLFRIMKRYGQGGARRESVSVDTPLTDGLADDTRWIWGMFYVDRNDPSIMVEKRFGVGYTLNYGNRTAILIVLTFIVLSLGVIGLLLFGSWVLGG